MKKNLFKNFILLGGIQATNLLIPLIISPFVINKIGLSLFGQISITQVIASYGIILTNYGFQITAVREIAIADNPSPAQLSAIFNKYFFSTITLLLLACLIIIGIALVVATNNLNLYIYISSIAIVIGQAFIPTWFFQGINQNKLLVIPTIIGRVMSVLLVLFFIKNSNHAPLVNLFLGGGNLIAFAILTKQLNKTYNIKFKCPKLSIIAAEIKSGFYLFLSNIGVNVYTTSGILFLGYSESPVVVGIFAVCDRVIQLLRAFLSFFFLATYPTLCVVAQQGKRTLKKFIIQTYPFFCILVLLLCIGIYTLSDIVAFYFVKGTNTTQVSLILKKCSFIPFIISLNIPFNQLLLVYLKDKLYAKILLGCSIISILMYAILIPIFKLNGLIGIIYFIEISVTVTLIYFATLYFKSL